MFLQLLAARTEVAVGEARAAGAVVEAAEKAMVAVGVGEWTATGMVEAATGMVEAAVVAPWALAQSGKG
jgi:hypothetical protein